MLVSASHCQPDGADGVEALVAAAEALGATAGNVRSAAADCQADDLANARPFAETLSQEPAIVATPARPTAPEAADVER